MNAILPYPVRHRLKDTEVNAWTLTDARTYTFSHFFFFFGKSAILFTTSYSSAQLLRYFYLLFSRMTFIDIPFS